VGIDPGESILAEKQGGVWTAHDRALEAVPSKLAAGRIEDSALAERPKPHLVEVTKIKEVLKLFDSLRGTVASAGHRKRAGCGDAPSPRPSVRAEIGLRRVSVPAGGLGRHPVREKRTTCLTEAGGPFACLVAVSMLSFLRRGRSTPRADFLTTQRPNGCSTHRYLAELASSC
jgi:hypothetical protein